ncbi:hypothetical protein, partial [Mesorhizobium sanjuanii]|uniref:hypothetical protein n=1 Tax=Mesorhizobium sanjuanii TaxID=2037900 RepID=UPI001AD80499
MPQLVVFVIKNLATGAMIGLFVAGWLVAFGSFADLLPSGDDSYLAIGIVAYSMASTFGLG